MTVYLGVSFEPIKGCGHYNTTRPISSVVIVLEILLRFLCTGNMLNEIKLLKEEPD